MGDECEPGDRERERESGRVRERGVYLRSR